MSMTAGTVGTAGTSHAPARSVRRVLIMDRDQTNRQVPARRRGAPTAQAVARARRALEALGVEVVRSQELDACRDAQDIDFVLVLGGDGTILHASELARAWDVPLVGVNTGHVGFLAEASPEAVEQVVADVVAGRYTVDERMTLAVEVISPDGSVETTWALNEAALEKVDRARMLELAIGVDGQAVSSFGCDGLVVATPTGSTAYAFSAGGPVIWPEVEALLVVPLAAHALFTRPLVLGPRSCVEVVVQHTGDGGAELWCDGRRAIQVPSGARIRVSAGDRPVRLARLNQAPFASRLVGKFDLPVTGWRTLSRQAAATASPTSPANAASSVSPANAASPASPAGTVSRPAPPVPASAAVAASAAGPAGAAVPASAAGPAGAAAQAGGTGQQGAHRA